MGTTECRAYQTKNRETFWCDSVEVSPAQRMLYCILWSILVLYIYILNARNDSGTRPHAWFG